MSNQPLSPQGYNLGRAPKNTNPFFDILKRGVTATVAIGRVIVNTLAPESDATVSVENSGTATDGVFDFTFGIPAGKDGKDGTDGLNASVRAVNSAVVEDVPYGGTPFCFVQNLGTEQDANFKFTFGIPAGKDGKDGTDGEDGAPGAPGAPGADGVGVPPGGTTGQVLAKKTNADYDTEWVNQSGGGGGGGGSKPTSRSVINWLTVTASGLTGSYGAAVVVSEEIEPYVQGYNMELLHFMLNFSLSVSGAKTAGTSETLGTYSTSDLNLPFGPVVTVIDSLSNDIVGYVSFSSGTATIHYTKSLSSESLMLIGWLHNISVAT